LSKFKLVAAHAEKKSPMVLRRAKLTGKIDHPISAAKAATTGDIYASKRLKFMHDRESGERNAVEIASRVKQWWWKASNGKINLVPRYGSKPIELSKGRNAIEVGNMEELIAALEAVKDAVQAGELDAQIEQARGSLRAGFAKKK